MPGPQLLVLIFSLQLIILTLLYVASMWLDLGCERRVAGPGHLFTAVHLSEVDSQLLCSCCTSTICIINWIQVSLHSEGFIKHLISYLLLYTYLLQQEILSSHISGAILSETVGFVAGLHYAVLIKCRHWKLICISYVAIRTGTGIKHGLRLFISQDWKATAHWTPDMIFGRLFLAHC